jgi:hypothetical protein
MCYTFNHPKKGEAMALVLTYIKVIYSGREYEIDPSRLAMIPTTVDDLKRVVERYLELPSGALESYMASEVEGRWVIAPAPIYG